LSHLESRWDGKNPTKKGGTEVPLIARIIEYAVIAELYRRAGGVRAAVELAQQRAGGQFDPEVCSSVEKNAPSLFEGFGGLSLWDVYLEAEPGTRLTLGGAEIRTVAEAFADFSDNKCGFLVGHSRQVASLAFLAGEVLGLDQEDRVGLSIGALLHDVGRAGVPNGVWDKPAALDRRERRMAESHSTHTENVLVSSSAFEAITELSSSVHERADGTGYHRRRSLDSLKAGIVAAADVYDALVHDRPWREAFDEARAADELIKEADSGHLPRKAVRAVLEVAGHGKRVADRAYPDGLTRREVAVLEHLARGLTTKEIAAKLSMATKTADNHIQNLYKKIGATSRTAAAMYALERGIFTN